MDYTQQSGCGSHSVTRIMHTSRTSGRRGSGIILLLLSSEAGLSQRCGDKAHRWGAGLS